LNPINKFLNIKFIDIYFISEFLFFLIVPYSLPLKGSGREKERRKGKYI